MLRFTPVRRPGRAVSAAGAAALLLFALLAGCGPSEEERTSTARAEAWAELEAAQAALNAKRGELEQLREQAAAPAEGEDAEAPAARVDALDEEIGADGEAFQQKLVNYINEAEWELDGEMKRGAAGGLRDDVRRADVPGPRVRGQGRRLPAGDRGFCSGPR